MRYRLDHFSKPYGSLFRLSSEEVRPSGFILPRDFAVITFVKAISDGDFPDGIECPSQGDVECYGSSRYGVDDEYESLQRSELFERLGGLVVAATEIGRTIARPGDEMSAMVNPAAEMDQAEIEALRSIAIGISGQEPDSQSQDWQPGPGYYM